MSGGCLRMTIPAHYAAEVTTTPAGVVVSIPMSGDEDFKELGNAFVSLAVSCWRKAPLAAASGSAGNTDRGETA